MKKRILPIPLILLIPIVMLVVVTVAGVYRFSLSDEEIMAKFPSQQQQMDPVLKSVFSISSPNPWTIEVPEVRAFSFINQFDADKQIASGRYDAGAERGSVLINTQWLTQVTENDYVSTLAVSNQGSGEFYYAAHFYYDQALKRMVLKESEFLGDRISLTLLSLEGDQIRFEYLAHDKNDAMSSVPTQKQIRNFILSQQGRLQAAE
tara:strand:- start:6995 stop:7612 length:618 start_codon:yes stop_codon:yes gene_type:complete